MTSTVFEILIVTAHFAPENAVAALRTTAMADCLRQAGWPVGVVTRGRRGTAPEAQRIVDPVATARCWKPRTRAGRILLRVASGLSFRLMWPDEQVVWTVRALRQIRRADSSVILVVSVPPFSLVLLALAIRRRAVVLDYRDLWTVGTYYEGSRLRRKLERWVETRALRGAKLALTVSEPLAEDLRSIAGRTPVVVIRNGFDPADFTGFDHSPSVASGPLRILYVGELYAKKRDPTPLFRCLAADEWLRANVVVEFYGRSVGALSDQVRRLGLTDTVRLAPRVSHEEALRLQERADVLLLLLWNDPGEAGVYSGKLFEYLGARRRILMLGYPAGVAAELVEERQAGVVANDPDAIGQALHHWVDEKSRGSLTRLPESAAFGLSRSAQFEAMPSLLRSVSG